VEKRGNGRDHLTCKLGMQLRKSALWKHYIRRQDPKIFEKYKTVRNKVGSYTKWLIKDSE